MFLFYGMVLIIPPHQTDQYDYLGHIRKPEKSDMNWMPVPSGYFMLVMRLYEPAPEALNNEYLLPRVKLVRRH